MNKHESEQYLSDLEEDYWLLKAIEAEKEGYIGHEKTAKLINKVLNNKNPIK